MKRSFLGLWLLWAACAGSSTALAQATVYRCGPDANQYSAKPCPGGRAVDVTDVRSTAQQKEAQHLAQHERGLAQAWQAERLARERAAPRMAAGIRVAGNAAAGTPAAASAQEQGERKMGKRPGDKGVAAGSRAAAEPRPGFQIRLPAPRVSKPAARPAQARR